MTAQRVLAIDFGATKIALALADIHGHRPCATRIRTCPEQGAEAAVKRTLVAARGLMGADTALALGVATPGIPLAELCGLEVRSVAELLVEVGDPRRLTEGGFARFNGSATLPASIAEGPCEPVRHR